MNALNEEALAPGNIFASNTTFLVGQASVADASGVEMIYSLTPADQLAILTTDDGQSIVLGKYSINPTTGEISIELNDYATGSPESLAQSVAVNSLRDGVSYNLSDLVVSAGGENTNTLTQTVTPQVVGVNDAVEALPGNATFHASEHSIDWDSTSPDPGQASGPSSLNLADCFSDADYGDMDNMSYQITSVSLDDPSAVQSLLGTYEKDGASIDDLASLNRFISDAVVLVIFILKMDSLF